MSNTFRLVVSSVGQTYFDGDASSATFAGSEGEFTVLPHHEPLVTTLKSGAITVKIPSGEVKKFDAQSGILEFSGNRAMVLL